MKHVHRDASLGPEDSQPLELLDMKLLAAVLFYELLDDASVLIIFFNIKIGYELLNLIWLR
jgi:hypothetical protein